MDEPQNSQEMSPEEKQAANIQRAITAMVNGIQLMDERLSHLAERVAAVEALMAREEKEEKEEEVAEWPSPWPWEDNGWANIPVEIQRKLYDYQSKWLNFNEEGEIVDYDCGGRIPLDWVVAALCKKVGLNWPLTNFGEKR